MVYVTSGAQKQAERINSNAFAISPDNMTAINLVAMIGKTTRPDGGYDKKECITHDHCVSHGTISTSMYVPIVSHKFDVKGDITYLERKNKVMIPK